MRGQANYNEAGKGCGLCADHLFCNLYTDSYIKFDTSNEHSEMRLVDCKPPACPTLEIVWMPKTVNFSKNVQMFAFRSFRISTRPHVCMQLRTWCTSQCVRRGGRSNKWILVCGLNNTSFTQNTNIFFLVFLIDPCFCWFKWMNVLTEGTTTFQIRQNYTLQFFFSVQRSSLIKRIIITYAFSATFTCNRTYFLHGISHAL